MMKQLILTTIILVLTWSLINEDAQANGDLASTKNTVAILDHQSGHETTNQLESRIRQIYAVAKRFDRYKKFRRFRSHGKIVYSKKGDSHDTDELEGWTPFGGGECPCGPDCNCPPLVCDNDHCDANYVVVFGSKTCPPCYMMKKVMQYMAKKGYITYYIDTDEHVGAFDKFDLKGWPTIIIFEDGKPKHRFNKSVSAYALMRLMATKKQQGL
jgi:thiol-disulfide isomerase/thioredoxin